MLPLEAHLILSQGKLIGTVRVWGGWLMALAVLNFEKHSRVLCFRRRSQKGLIAWKSSKACRIALENILMSMQKVRRRIII
jgi:hypothetical protein